MARKTSEAKRAAREAAALMRELFDAMNSGSLLAIFRVEHWLYLALHVEDAVAGLMAVSHEELLKEARRGLERALDEELVEEITRHWLHLGEDDRRFHALAFCFDLLPLHMAAHAYKLQPLFRSEDEARAFEQVGSVRSCSAESLEPLCRYYGEIGAHTAAARIEKCQRFIEGRRPVSAQLASA